MSGYLHPAYAASLAEFGRPRELRRCGGWLLEREIPDSSLRDAMGCYPIFACRDWSRVGEDLLELEHEWVSVVLVTDPFGVWDRARLENTFDRVVPFHEHHVVDLARPLESQVSKHHRYYARRALRDVTVERCAEPARFTAEWTRLYACVLERHAIRDLRAFSPAAFAQQLRVPGIVLFRALLAGDVVGASLWYLQEEVAYYHLLATTPTGHERMVSYALVWRALESFVGAARWADLGGAAGSAGTEDGLRRFKSGWAPVTRVTFLCGRICNPRVYARLAGERAGYFPAYRAGEFS